MQEIINFLKENKIGALATVENGMPKVRPMGFLMEDQGRFYFSANKNKKVSKQLKEVPFAEFTSWAKNLWYVRLWGKVTFVNDHSINERAFNMKPFLKSLYTSVDNPLFEVFCIEHGEAIISDRLGKSKREIRF